MWWYGRGNSGGSWLPAFPHSCQLNADDTYLFLENLEYSMTNVVFKNSNVNVYILRLHESKHKYSLNVKQLNCKQSVSADK